MPLNTYMKKKDVEINKFFTKCFVCGDDNPYGLHLTNTYMDGRSHVEITPGLAQMGLSTGGDSGLMHGGFTMMLFDEALYYVCKAGLGVDVVTINMNIDFKSPAIVGHCLAAEAWVTDRDGRKIFLEGSVFDMDNENKEVAHCKGLYMEMDLTRFLKVSD